MLVITMKHSLLLALLIFAMPVHAAVFRCVGADGTTTYSQTPCSTSAEKIVVDRSPGANGTADCAFAEKFIRSTSRLMRQGVNKDQLFNQLGGPSAFDAGATKIVHYVYQYQDTQNMSQDRITELAVAKCNAGSFGGVNCESLPKSYTDAGGGCGESFSAHRAEFSVDVSAIRQAEADERRQASAELRKKQSEEMQKYYADMERGTQCRQKIQAKISQVEARIYAGADPHGQRSELESLRTKLGKCGSYRSPPVIDPNDYR